MAQFTIPRLSLRSAVLISLGLIAVIAGTLLWMGRVPICKCGHIKLWDDGQNDEGASQHLIDRYTYSHVLHGIIFYWLLWAVFRNRLSIGARLVIAVLIEGAWEIFENSSFILNRYRTQSPRPRPLSDPAADELGDAVINSIGDMLAMIVGFLLAARLPPWVTVLLLIATEVIMVLLIRDNLLLNIILLIYPLEWIKQWQLGVTLLDR